MTTNEATGGIVLIGHGIRVDDASDGVRALARQLQETGP